MKKILACLLLVISSFAHAEWKDWSPEEQKMFVASEIAIFVDWGTTRNGMFRANEGFYEKNPILGPHPGVDRVDAYMLTMMISNYFIADWFDNKRMAYLTIRTAGHGFAAANNLSLGLNIQF